VTTILVLVVDPPPAALHDPDPVGWTAGFVRGALIEAGLVVHDCSPRPELLLGVPAQPVAEVATEHVCQIPWCRSTFTQQHHLKMHMRSHQDVACQHCGGTYKLTGLHSHEAHCRQNPANWVETPREPAAEPRPRVTQAPAPAAKPKAPPPAMPVLGPIERRPFDPDKVRAHQADAQRVGI
jgi:hypothetical protein